MAISLVNELSDLFKSQALGSFAAQSGESESSVLRGFETTVGTMVAGLGSKLGQTGFARQIFDMVSGPGADTRVLDNVRNLASTGSRPSDAGSTRFLSMLFGSHQSGITDAISRSSGLRSSSAASLLGIGAPLVLGALGKRVRDGGMDVSRLSSFISQEAAGARDTLPSGITSQIGGEARQVAAEPRQAYAAVPPVAEGVVRERSRWWPWPVAAGLAALALLIGWAARRPHAHAVAYTAPYNANAYNTTSNLLTRRLPDNVDLRIPAGQMEDRLLSFIQDPSKPVDENTWFDFDRLLFDTNSGTLQPSSQDQLHNVAEILKAYPNVHVKIGGYTDNTGDANANQQLSQQRADSVKQELINMGVSADRLESQGYGSQYPVGDNSTDEGRQKNRRISLRVTQK